MSRKLRKKKDRRKRRAEFINGATATLVKGSKFATAGVIAGGIAIVAGGCADKTIDKDKLTEKDTTVNEKTELAIENITDELDAPVYLDESTTDADNTEVVETITYTVVEEDENEDETMDAIFGSVEDTLQKEESSKKPSNNVVSQETTKEETPKVEETTTESNQENKDEEASEEVETEEDNSKEENETTPEDEETSEGDNSEIEEDNSNEENETTPEDEESSEEDNSEIEEEHNVKMCIDGLELVPGGTHTITRNYTAVTLTGDEAMSLKRGDRVQLGSPMGGGSISILATNVHGELLPLIVREDVIDSFQKECAEDEYCEHGVSPEIQGRLSEAYARTNSTALFFPNKCTDKGAIEVPAGVPVLIKHYILENGKVLVSFDGGLTFPGYMCISNLEIDERNTELHNLTTINAVEKTTTKEIVGKGYGHEEGKSITISANCKTLVYTDSFDGSEIAVSFDLPLTGWRKTVLVSIEDAISAGLF